MHLGALGRTSGARHGPAEGLPDNEAAPTQRIALRGWLYIISPERMQGKGWQTGPMGALSPLESPNRGSVLWHEIEFGDYWCMV
jgi:hypothetical protein